MPLPVAGLGRFPAWVCVVVLFRELMVDGLRMVAMEQGRVIAAGKLGKIKTTLQMFTLVAVMLGEGAFGDFPLAQVLMYAAVAMTLWSGVDYFLRNGQVLLQKGGAR